MRGRIYRELGPVRRRQQALYLLRSAAWGLLAGSVAGIAAGIWQRVAGVQVSPALAGSILGAGPLLGLLVGWLRGRDWHRAAAAVDAHYHLKDRTATALEFLSRPEATPIHELQVQDAVEHLATIEPREVVPFRVPRTLLYAVGCAVAAILLLTWPPATRPAKAGPTAPDPAIVAEAKEFEENSLKQLDELAKNERDPKLEKLVEQLRKKVQEMKEPGIDVREALAKLSEMQAAIAQQQAQYNTGLVDGQLQALGAALTPADALEAAGQALQEGKFDKAAEELEKLEDPELDRKEAKAVEEKLKQVAEAMGEAGLGQLSDAASELAEGVKGGGKGKFKKATKTLAKLTKAHARRRRINRLLATEVENLNESKNRCNNNSLARGRRPEKSKSPSSNFGLSTSGNVIGEKTNMLSKRNIQEITGEPGDGPSEMETTHSPEGRQMASRGYRDAYQKALKKSEAVLDSEPIPLGHRQTIRRYFESIRPQNEDGGDKAKDEPATK
jgi:hypothetical protein